MRWSRRSWPRADAADHHHVKQLVADIKTYEARIRRAADDYYVHDRLPEERYLEVTARLEAMIAQARGELRRLALARAVTVLPEEAVTAADIRAEWDRRDLAWRRAVIRGVTRKITLAPQGRGSRFDPDATLRIEWADRPVNPADDPRDHDLDQPTPSHDQATPSPRSAEPGAGTAGAA